MNTKEIISEQEKERLKCVKAILSSKSNKKLIIASAGTGKTHIFKKLLEAHPDRNNITLTFINRLTNDMARVLGDLAEVKTFHGYCKKILHEQNGKVDLYPFLTQIITEDADYLGLSLADFDKKFQLLDERSSEVEFYLKRGDYYDAVSFNDSVYRLYKQLSNKPDIIPSFSQILIDEFQDFNPLEVAFINKLENKGNILIVGDDDQSVYEDRCASPDYLREKYSSGEYEIFELPYCGRCPEVIVNAANDLIYNAEEAGYLVGRVKKRFECYIGEKEYDSFRFPKIHTARCTNGKLVAKYIDTVIQSIDSSDIEESWKEENNYTSVLIAGPKQYLMIIQKRLAKKYPQISYKYSEQATIKVTDGYDSLLKDSRANLGWRVLIDFYFGRNEIMQIIRRSDTGDQLVDILNKDFIQQQEKVVEIIRSIKQDQDFDKSALKKYTGIYYDVIIEYYSLKEENEEEQIDKTKPSILLSSFVGCKGLSAGHVIIVGANNGSIPKDTNNIRDIEIAQFLVALTRTRKQCHVVSDRWLISPYINNVYQEENHKSIFLDWINNELTEDHGDLRANDF